ncbi:chaperone modulator CbpM [Polaromonas sp. UC242_47]|uniref:chaperone modulator CbpM n=1 Tax=Polaromonas sp. UC242_47 TaxID=3374626 RepID=UPI00379A8AC8
MTSHTAIPQLIGFVLEDQTELTLADLCRACATQANVVIELVDEGLIVPSGPTPEYWRFTGLHMQRALVALRLQEDLGVNLAGAALALQLLEELETLRSRLRVLEET